MKQRKIRIAYDVSCCAGYHGHREKTTGVGRVIESIAGRVADSGEFELWMTGCYGGDPRPAYTSAKARIYWEERWRDADKHGVSEGCGASFLESTRSRTGLYPFYSRALAVANDWDDGLISPPARVWRKSLNALARWDVKAGARADGANGGFDLFHSPFNPLPGKEVTGAAPLVLTVHDLLPLNDPGESVSKMMLQEKLKRLDPHRDWAICVSDFTRKELCAAIGLPEERTVVAPLAAEPVFRPIRSRDGLAKLLAERKIPSGPYFLSVANPQPRKNIPLLVRSFQQLASEPGGERVHLFLVGSQKLGWGQEAINEQIATVPAVRDRIFQLGAVSDEELALLYSHCTAFVFPSLSEGFGLPPLEAMQCGAPVICSNATSLPEVTGDAARSVPPEDGQALVEAMREIAVSPPLRAELSERSIRRAAQFSWDKTATIVMETYRKAIAGRGK